MQLLICPGYHAPALTDDFLQSLLAHLTPDQAPDQLWVLPLWAYPLGLPWLFNSAQLDRPLSIIAFSAGVVAAYPLLLAWQSLGGTGRLIAIDGWGMPLPGDLVIYRISHDHWTHRTTYWPSPAESRGSFYCQPAVQHLALWQHPHLSQGMGDLGTGVGPMTALEFICGALGKT
ncbi:hypothetical protein [Leptothoe sp. PORK10 BA2]|uniref:hypothetical protein n=1 Tax=Leptothoe sp. PORK10 BA2 TaxID=3110254 RepID=UPI002B21C782|nr:hypothetical protein [Leptothoe sp. PORK10 BA2]MEA5464162.1 hypothetical protein [Leptothoe sp. PORK10 BA2]